MKRTILSITLITVLLASCAPNTEKKIINNIPFEGTWSRSFSMGETSAKVTYTIAEDSIHYAMNGPMDMQYTIKKDTFVSKDNKWIGMVDSTYYVIFAKNMNDKEVTILKLKSTNIEEALQMPFPSDTARSKFSSWNTFQKQ